MPRCSIRFLRVAAVAALLLFFPWAPRCAAQRNDTDSSASRTDAISIGKWVTFTANIPEAGFRRTDFYTPGYNTSVLQVDSRIELWLPPSSARFSWGPYLRLAGIEESQTAAYPNAWLAAPGVGFQIYPFSSQRFREPTSTAGKVLGPLRLFAEYDVTDYVGAINSWRPHRQEQFGLDYWMAVNVNDTNRAWWLEVWTGAYWLASNEFTPTYDTVQVANSWRSGVRIPRVPVVSALTPYFAVQSSRTKYDRVGTQGCGVVASLANPANPCDFWWENGLVAGGGLRIAPSLCKTRYKNLEWMNRLVFYAEYLDTVTYYGPDAPASIPRYDLHAGVSASFGNWYQQAPACRAAR